MTILSFHPCFEGNRFINCAGRDPGDGEISAIRDAAAVVLPQGCRRSLYIAAKTNCANVFPNYDAKFGYPGKIGQIRLFQKTGAAHPKSHIFENVSEFAGPPLPFPFVFKFSWGDEGDTVFLVESETVLKDLMEKAVLSEHTGQAGFLIQEYVPNGNRTLRVVIAGTRFFAYWRVAGENSGFASNVSQGGILDHESDPDLRTEGISAVKNFCRKTGINLAGFDLIFPENGDIPLFLEINYFFGRRGLGGSDKYYEILIPEIEKWVETVL